MPALLWHDRAGALGFAATPRERLVRKGPVWLPEIAPIRTVTESEGRRGAFGKEVDIWKESPRTHPLVQGASQGVDYARVSLSGGGDLDRFRINLMGVERQGIVWPCDGYVW